MIITADEVSRVWMKTGRKKSLQWAARPLMKRVLPMNLTLRADEKPAERADRADRVKKITNKLSKMISQG